MRDVSLAIMRRYHRGMNEEQALVALRNGALDLYLDTTYCSAQYNFPRQEEVRERAKSPSNLELEDLHVTSLLQDSFT